MEKLYKVLGENGKPHNGGSGTWSLPAKNDDGTWTPGEWMPAIEGELISCENGYHLCREGDLIHWLGPRIYDAEYRGDRIDSYDKVVVREARLLREYETWNEKTARLFACWCVRNTPLADGRTVWDLLEDERSKKAVEVAEKYAQGEATDEELKAALAAVLAVAWSAARDAALATSLAVAWSAAREAAWAAAWAAAMDAQTKRLIDVLMAPVGAGE